MKTHTSQHSGIWPLNYFLAVYSICCYGSHSLPLLGSLCRSSKILRGLNDVYCSALRTSLSTEIYTMSLMSLNTLNASLKRL